MTNITLTRTRTIKFRDKGSVVLTEAEVCWISLFITGIMVVLTSNVTFGRAPCLCFRCFSPARKYIVGWLVGCYETACIQSTLPCRCWLSCNMFNLAYEIIYNNYVQYVVAEMVNHNFSLKKYIKVIKVKIMICIQQEAQLPQSNSASDVHVYLGWLIQSIINQSRFFKVA